MKTIKVLLIEDDEEDAQIVREFLESSQIQFSLEVATSSGDGLEKLKNEDFGCVLVDYIIPGVSGINLIQEMQKSGYHLPCILLTGYGDDELKQELLQQGAFDYLSKRDLSLSSLETKIHEALLWNYKKDLSPQT